MSALSQSTIHRSTILQSMMDFGKDDWFMPEDIGKILKMPEGYPISGVLSNMLKTNIVEKKNSGRIIKGKNRQVYRITERGIQRLNDTLEFVEEYGKYTLVYKDSNQTSLPLEPEPPKYSPAVQAAMDELSQVASINEHSLNCLNDIKQVLEAFFLKQDDTNYKVSGSLKAIQEDTKSMQKSIKGIESLVNLHLGE